MVCDFCAAPGPARSYPCQDFDDPVGLGRCIGSWMACDDCAGMIDGELWDELAVKSVSGVSHDAEEHPLLLGYARKLHKLFRANRL